MQIRTQPLKSKTSANCKHCGKKSLLISQALGLCADCIRRDFAQVLPHIKEARRESRKPFALPSQPPQDEKGKDRESPLTKK